jgi:NarL family two-component system response regulator YdfI
VARVLIATASETTRSWFAAFPARPEGVSIVDIARLDAALPARVQALDPDLVIIDVADSDVETVASTLESIGDAAVDIVLLMDGERRQVPPSELLYPGVRAVLPRQPTIDELEAAVRAVEAGLIVVAPGVFQALARHDDGASTPRTTSSTMPEGLATGLSMQRLTPREVEVLSALAEGHGNKGIAARLGISEHTVKTHLAAIFEKLGASNRTEAVMAGARLGILLL